MIKDCSTCRGTYGTYDPCNDCGIDDKHSEWKPKFKSVIKYPGAKWRIANWIEQFIPKHHSYLEPFFGSGALFFTKAAARIETINDLDNDVTNLFRIIRDNPEPLIKSIALTPFSRAEYENAYAVSSDNEMEQARQFLIRCWQGHGFRTSGYKAGWKNDIQGREAAYALRNWYRLPYWIDDIVDRLKDVQIECRPAEEVIKRFNYKNVFIYADPPYLLSTRSGKQYKHEMTDKDHAALLECMLNHRGTAIISGYDNELYNKMLVGWEKYSINTLAEKGLHRVESIWIKK